MSTPAGPEQPGDTQGYGPPPGYAPPQGYGLPPGYGAPGYAAPPSTETKAIVALVLAIGSFVVFPLVPAIVALCLAPGAKRDIETSGGRLTGLGLVTASKIVAWCNVALSALVVGFLVIGIAALSSSGFS